jgi:hypothetical protein
MYSMMASRSTHLSNDGLYLIPTWRCMLVGLHFHLVQMR